MTVRSERQQQTRLTVGTDIEVRDRFCASWQRGFALAGTTNTGYLVRRRTDNYVLPVQFAADEVRPIA